MEVVPGENCLSVPGSGCAEFCCVPQTVPSIDGSHAVKLKTVNSKLYSTYPLRLMVTQSRCHLLESDCQWLYKVHSGGQVNGGNYVSVDIGVGEQCKVVFTTHDYPKILASDSGLVTKQEIKVRVADKAILAVLPDPILCYENAIYQQQQVYHLTSEANLILLDWLIAGRIALGEVWDMASFVSENKVYINGSLVYGDAINLDREHEREHSIKESLRHTKVLGNCVFIGPYFTELKRTILNKVNEISGDEASNGLTVSASVLNQPLCDGIVIRLLAAQSTEQDGKVWVQGFAGLFRCVPSARSFFRRLIEDTTSWFRGNPLEK